MTQLFKIALIVTLSLGIAHIVDLSAANEDALRKALTFHASFDGKHDADFALGDRRLHTATSYKKREDAKPMLDHPDVSLALGAGRYGDALKFAKKNTRAVYYPAEKNVAHRTTEWSGRSRSG